MLKLLSDFSTYKSYFEPSCFIDIDTHDISGYTVATQYLRNLQISEAEMTV